MMRQLSLTMALASVALAPLVAGGNRPLVWALAAVWVGIAGLLVVVAPVGVSSRNLGSLAIPGVVYGAFLVWAIVQALPWPGVSGPAIGGAGAIAPPTLSLSPADTLLSAMTMATTGLLFLIVSQTTRSARAPLTALFVIATAQAAWALISLRFLGDTVMGAEKVQYQGFATGTFVNRNAFADFVGCGVPIGVCLLALQLRDMVADGANGRRLLNATLLAAGLAVLSVALISSGSRMALFATASATGICLLLLAFRYRRELPIGWLLLATAVVAVVLFVIFGGGLTDRTFEVVQDAAVRSELYRQVWAAILQSPLAGYGGGSFAVAFPVFEAPPLPGHLIWSKAHSTYLALFFEYGLIGGALPIIAVLWVVGGALWSVVRSHGGYAQIAAIGVAVVFGIHSLVDFGLEMHGNALLFAAVLGVASGSLAVSPVHKAAGPVFSAKRTAEDREDGHAATQ